MIQEFSFFPEQEDQARGEGHGPGRAHGLPLAPLCLLVTHSSAEQPYLEKSGTRIELTSRFVPPRAWFPDGPGVTTTWTKEIPSSASPRCPRTCRILATRWLVLLRSRGRRSYSHKARRNCSALPAQPRLHRGYPTERGGPPPVLGLSPGLCGPGRTVAYLMHRTGILRVGCARRIRLAGRRRGFGVPLKPPSPGGEYLLCQHLSNSVWIASGSERGVCGPDALGFGGVGRPHDCPTCRFISNSRRIRRRSRALMHGWSHCCKFSRRRQCPLH